MRTRVVLILTLLFAHGTILQARADDEVIYRDPAAKKEVRVVGAILSETPSQLVMRPNEGPISKTIPVEDVIDVIYQVPALLRQDYRAALHRESAARTARKAHERRRELSSARERYQELLPKLTAASAKCHVEYSIARLYALETEIDKAQTPTAIEHLTRFLANHPESWQQFACADLLANLQYAKSDWSGAQKTYEALLSKASLSPTLRQDCGLKVVDSLLRAGKAAEAERKIASLSKAAPSDGALSLRLQIASAECRIVAGQPDAAIPLLEAVIAATDNPDLRARAYNVLGDCHLRVQKPREALWDYLWVDVIYFDNRQEHARSLYHLSKLFHDSKDEPRSKLYRDRLEKDPRFAGIEYRLRSLGEPAR